MKLLILAKRTTAHGFGGMETHVELLARTAVELGHEAALLTTAHPLGLVEEIRDGVQVEYLAGTPPGLDSRIWWRKSAEATQRLLSQGHIDLILSLSLAGYGVAAAKVKIPHYAFVFGRTLDHLVSEWYDWPDLKGLALYPKHALALLYYAGLEQRFWSRLDGIIATYDALHQDLFRRRRRVFLCYNGTDPRQFQPAQGRRLAIRQALGIGQEAQVILMAATVNRQKGIWLGLDAFRRLAASFSDLHLIIVGDGPDRCRLELTLRESPLVGQVHFVGAVTLQEMAAYFAAADLFLYPTLRMEGLPNAIVQAMATGLPVIASDRGGVCSAVQHGKTGLLLPAPAVEPLVETTARLLSDSDLRVSMGQQARKLALRSFDMRVLVAGLLQELSDVVRVR